ncbi:hypothetical protein GO730_20825 [Spirosoma sp. HMF3257]|uniref:Uncharacterized protein n=1 Tax=Spirosoma telluris TaxID=2183553 RepID=A0A327NLB3_9BACT|nr:hypothetical protein [Spirosoma telluris]RAI75992.1 hypothetical protein HMF3257_20750 [Spirosoma telluris]
MNGILKPISAEAVTGFKRIGIHEFFGIAANLEMIQQIRVRVLDEAGTPIVQRIADDENLNPLQKQNALQRYQDQIITKQTEGAFVDRTGKVVPADAEGAIPQRMFIQGITLGALKAMGVPITDETSVASLLYSLIGNEIGNIDARGDL